MTRHTLAFSAAAVLCLAPIASAHTGHGAHGFNAGFVHPIAGVDHLLAMFVVGWWSTRQSETRPWLLPAAFVGAMILGLIHGLVGRPLPGVEGAIAASVLLLGGLLAFGKNLLPLAAAFSVTALAGFFHGHAHGSEIPAGASAFTFTAGMVLTTSLLHLFGVTVGLSLKRNRSAALPAARLGGAAVACCGAALLAGWM